MAVFKRDRNSTKFYNNVPDVEMQLLVKFEVNQRSLRSFDDGIFVASRRSGSNWFSIVEEFPK